MQQLSGRQIAWRVAQDIPDGAYVNLGSGMPQMVPAYVPAGRTINFRGTPRQTSELIVPDYSILGAFEVAQNGDFASWELPIGRDAPAAGGAPDLAVGVNQVCVMMEYFAKDGSAKLVPQCTLPLTGRRCVTTVYTDIAVLDLREGKVWLREIIEGITLHTLQMETDVQLHVSPQLRLLQAPVLG